MTPDKVARLLKKHMMRHVPDRSRRTPLTAIARMADVTRQTVYNVMWGKFGHVGPAAFAKLSEALEQIERGEVTFRRNGGAARGRPRFEGEYSEPRGRTSTLYPNRKAPLPPQDRMVRAGDYIDGACCRSCGGWIYTRVTLHGVAAQWFLCDGCLWWETAGMAAQPARRKK